jgi:hypothetical protein
VIGARAPFPLEQKKSRKLKLPIEITAVFHDYVEAYKVDDALFPYTPAPYPVSHYRNSGKSGGQKESFRANSAGYLRGSATEKGRGN